MSTYYMIISRGFSEEFYWSFYWKFCRNVLPLGK